MRNTNQNDTGVSAELTKLVETSDFKIKYIAEPIASLITLFNVVI